MPYAIGPTVVLERPPRFFFQTLFTERNITEQTAREPTVQLAFIRMQVVEESPYFTMHASLPC